MSDHTHMCSAVAAPPSGRELLVAAVEIAHADADVIDPLDCDGLGHCELLPL